MDLATLDSLDRETLIRLILSQPEIIERIEDGSSRRNRSMNFNSSRIPGTQFGGRSCSLRNGPVSPHGSPPSRRAE